MRGLMFVKLLSYTVFYLKIVLPEELRLPLIEYRLFLRHNSLPVKLGRLRSGPSRLFL
jgi:hypothetical protein